MNSLSTALALIAVLTGIAAVIASFVGYRMIDRADELLHEVEAERRKLKTIRDDQVALHARMDRLAGRIYAQTRKPEPLRAATIQEPEMSDYGELDPELAAELALQTAPQVSPGKRN